MNRRRGIASVVHAIVLFMQPFCHHDNSIRPHRFAWKVVAAKSLAQHAANMGNDEAVHDHVTSSSSSNNNAGDESAHADEGAEAHYTGLNLHACHDWLTWNVAAAADPTSIAAVLNHCPPRHMVDWFGSDQSKFQSGQCCSLFVVEVDFSVGSLPL